MKVMLNGYIQGFLIADEVDEGSIQLLPSAGLKDRLATLEVSDAPDDSVISVGDTIRCLRLGMIAEGTDSFYVKETDVLSCTKE